MKQKTVLKKIMKERHLNQASLARELGITESHLSKVMKGDRGLGISVAIAAAKMAGISLEEFFA